MSCFYVAKHGADSGRGSTSDPLLTISEAARRAMPGDSVVVHAGIYRESVDPPRGGTGEHERISYRAAVGEQVEIRGSEVVTGWEPTGRGMWRVRLPNTFFVGFNPFAEPIGGDWFNPQGIDHVLAAVYLDGTPLRQARYFYEIGDPFYQGVWSAVVEPDHTTIQAQFYDADPNVATVEVNVRRSLFYPSKPGIDYLTVSGFVLQHAATPWAPPTAEQVGAIGTNWSKGWIIERNTVCHSRCTGITLGKYGDKWDNTSSDTAEGYVATVERALQNGWNRATVGSHIVRRNTVAHCGQAGIVGSLGAIFSEISDNVIHDIHQDTGFSGAEMAGIKFHGAVDTVIRGNRISRSSFGIWLDWMSQGTRVTGNLMYENDLDDLFVEVNHGPFIVDHNVMLSPASLRDWSQGGAYIHNLIGGRILQAPEPRRSTPYLEPHATATVGFNTIHGGDSRFLGNIIVDTPGLESYAATALPSVCRDNSYARTAPTIQTEGEAVWLYGLHRPPGSLASVSTAVLAATAVSDLPFEAPEGGPLVFASDYFGAARDPVATPPGPFAAVRNADQSLQLWPKPHSES